MSHSYILTKTVKFAYISKELKVKNAKFTDGSFELFSCRKLCATDDAIMGPG
jgi:hypothetical protein